MNFLQNAHIGKNEFWRYLITVLVVVAAHFLGQIPLGIVMMMNMSSNNISNEEMQTFSETMDFGILGIAPNMAMFLLLLSFLAAFFALYFCVRYLHQKPFKTIITAAPTINWSKIAFAFLFWMGASLLVEVVSYVIQPEIYTYQLDWKVFLPLLLMAVVLLPFQTSFEELMFRGYLMQGISLWKVPVWVPLVITSVAFGLMHSMNPEIGKFGYGLMMTYYIGVGLFLGLITLLDNGLELALGIHAATNIYGAVFVTFEGSALQTPAIFRLETMDAVLMLILFFVMAGLFTFITGKRYGWKFEIPTNKMASSA